VSARDYVISFGYGAQDGYWYGPNGIVGSYHKGNDRPTPSGEPIVIGDTTIGLTGASGKVSGPHLHTQAWIGSPTSGDRDPTPYEFKGGTVVATGLADQWGNYITIEVDGVNLTYAHLRQIFVSTGAVIKVDTMALDKGYIKEVYEGFKGKEPSQADIDWHAANSTPESLVHGFFINNDVPMKFLPGELQQARVELASVKKELADLKKQGSGTAATPDQVLGGEIVGLIRKAM
jgi:hypothetical protein